LAKFEMKWVPRVGKRTALEGPDEDTSVLQKGIETRNRNALLWGLGVLAVATALSLLGVRWAFGILDRKMGLFALLVRSASRKTEL